MMWMESVLILSGPPRGTSPRRPQLPASLSGRSAIPALSRHLLRMVPGTFRGQHFPWQVCLLAGPTSRFVRAGERHLGSICGCWFAHVEGRGKKEPSYTACSYPDMGWVYMRKNAQAEKPPAVHLGWSQGLSWVTAGSAEETPLCLVYILASLGEFNTVWYEHLRVRTLPLCLMG